MGGYDRRLAEIANQYPQLAGEAQKLIGLDDSVIEALVEVAQSFQAAASGALDAVLIAQQIGQAQGFRNGVETLGSRLIDQLDTIKRGG